MIFELGINININISIIIISTQLQPALFQPQWGSESYEQLYTNVEESAAESG